MCCGVFGTRGEVRGSLVVLAVKRSFLCSFLRGVSCWGCGRVSGCFGSRLVISVCLLLRCGMGYFGVLVVERLTLCSSCEVLSVVGLCLCR